MDTIIRPDKASLETSLLDRNITLLSFDNDNRLTQSCSTVKFYESEDYDGDNWEEFTVHDEEDPEAPAV